MKFVLGLIGLLLLSSVYAKDFVKVGTTAAQFLKVEPGARALAMGGSYGALANDASALYWNPAGLTQIHSFQATFTHTRWIADIYNGFAGVVIPINDVSTAGISIQYQTMDEIEQTTIDQPKGTGLYYGAQDVAFGVSYSRKMTNFIMAGLTAKMVYQKIWNESATALAVDIGFLLDTGIRGLKVAMVMTNFGTDLKLDGRDLIRGYDQNPNSIMNPNAEARLSTEAWPLPTNLRLSLAMDLIGGENGALAQSATNRLTSVVDFTHPNDNREQYTLGLEYAFKEMLFGRIGYRANSWEEGLTLGGGMRISLVENVKLTVDYAYAEFGIFTSVQHFTIGLQF